MMRHIRFSFALAMAALAAILLPSSLPAQITFQRTYGGAGSDCGYSVQQTSDGGYIIAGSTESFGSGFVDVYLVKTDSSGDTLWTRAFGGKTYDVGNSVQQTADGGYLVAGTTNSFGAGCEDIYLVKTNADGDTLWTRTSGGEDDEDCNCIRQTADGGYIMTGSAGYIRAGGGHDVTVHLTKADANGRLLWTRTYTGAGHEDGHSVQQTADGGYIVAGHAWGPMGAGFDDVYLIKTDSVGDTLWTRTIGGSSWDMGYSIQQTADGGFIIAGETQSFNAGKRSAYLIKTDSGGDTLWTRTYGGTNSAEASSVRQTTDGGFVVVGLTHVPPKSSEVYLIKTDTKGDTLWTRTFGESAYGYSVQQTADGGYVVVGKTYSPRSGDGVYLIKTDPTGKVAAAKPKKH